MGGEKHREGVVCALGREIPQEIAPSHSCSTTSNTSLEGERGRFKIVSAYETSQNRKGKTRGVFFLSVYFQIGSEGSLRKISVHLPPRLHSSEHGSVRVTRSWRNNGNAQKASCQPTLLIVFQNSILAKWAFGFIHSNDFLVHCLE